MTESSTTCVVCGVIALTTTLEQARRTCDDCARLTGLIPLPPPRRPRRPCQRCNHDRLIRAIPRELSLLESSTPTSGPMFATYEIRSWARTVEPIHPRSGFGILEIYICRQCGFVEWYCQDPERIPIGPEYMTEEVTIGDGPFR
jgi:hypothetical protein